MANDSVYLKGNVSIEPLFDQWYAWSHLISPATAALNIKGRHLPIIDSYIKFPEIHEAATKKAEMKGGPFMDYAINRVSEIKELKIKTLRRQVKLLELAQAINDLNNLLKVEALGYSLEPLYDKIPTLLKGYVELVYDLYNRPSFRFFESLLYKSEYYNLEAQSISLQLIFSDDSRSFVLSTPRIENNESIHLDIPFKHSSIDELFKMREVPNSYNYIKNLLGITESKESLFKEFFTHKLPIKNKKFEGSGIRIRYFGHASILVETSTVSFLVDPIISYRYESSLERFTFEDLPEKIDYVLITHNHQDHVLFETLVQIRHKIECLVVPSSSLGSLQDPRLKTMLNQIGFNNVVELGDFDDVVSNSCIITGLPFIGEHSDLDIRSKVCYHISIKDSFSILFAADSCNKSPELYDNIKAIIGNIDVVFLGMECDGAPLSWLYGPLLPEPLDRDKDHSRRLSGSNYIQAINLIKTFNPSDVFVYAMGMEPWLEFISSIKYTDASRPIIESNKLIDKCKEMGISAERLYGEKTLEYSVKIR